MAVNAFSMSASLRKAMPLFGMLEPVQQTISNGVYLGRTEVYGLPFELRDSELLNPHIAIVGMSGSGKSFTLKNIIIRACEFHGRSAIILDWNGEYGPITNLLNGKRITPGGKSGQIRLPSRMHEGVTEIDLSAVHSDEARARIASDILDWIVDKMRLKNLQNGSHADTLVVIDEAWKALGSRSVGSLYREGRKYGFGIITATQLVGDVHNEIISNSACVLLFRIQNSNDYTILAKMGIANEEVLSRIGKLGIGNCLVSITPKGSAGTPHIFFLRQIDGLEQNFVAIKWKSGDGRIAIPKARMSSCMDGICGAEERGKLLLFLEESPSQVDLVKLIRTLILMGIRRADIIVYLRRLGIPDIAIVDSYDRAISKAQPS